MIKIINYRYINLTCHAYKQYAYFDGQTDLLMDRNLQLGVSLNWLWYDNSQIIFWYWYRI